MTLIDVASPFLIRLWRRSMEGADGASRIFGRATRDSFTDHSAAVLGDLSRVISKGRVLIRTELAAAERSG